MHPLDAPVAFAVCAALGFWAVAKLVPKREPKTHQFRRNRHRRRQTGTEGLTPTDLATNLKTSRLNENREKP